MRTIHRIGDPAAPAQEDPDSPRARRLIYVLLGVAIFRLWIMPLGSSFWIDETGTLWSVKDGFTEMLRRSAEWHLVSSFYGVVAWVAYAIGGGHEFVLRLPSLIAAATAALLLYRLAERLFNASAARAAVAVFVCSSPIAFAAADARPYALVLAVVIASTLSLVRWLDSGKAAYAALYALAAGMIPNAHLFASPVLVFHVVYAVLRMREGAAIQKRQALFVVLCIVLMALPLLPTLFQLAGKSRALVFSGTPTARAVIAQFVPPPIALGAIVGVVAVLLTCRGLHLAFFRVPASTCVLLCGIFLAPNLAFLGLAVLTPMKIFVTRYLIATIAAQAVLAGWALSLFQPARARLAVTCSLLLVPLIGMGQWTSFWPRHSRDDLRSAMAAVRQSAAGDALPVVFEIPFIESVTTTARPELSDNLPGFMLFPTRIYPPPDRLIPISFLLDGLSRAHLESTVLPQLAGTNRFVLVTWPGPNPNDDWFQRRFSNFAHRSVGDFGQVEVTLFNRSQ